MAWRFQPSTASHVGHIEHAPVTEKAPEPDARAVVEVHHTHGDLSRPGSSDQLLPVGPDADGPDGTVLGGPHDVLGRTRLGVEDLGLTAVTHAEHLRSEEDAVARADAEIRVHLHLDAGGAHGRSGGCGENDRSAASSKPWRPVRSRAGSS